MLSAQSKWKTSYQPTWEQAARREMYVCEAVAALTGCELAPLGLGVGQTELIDAEAHALDIDIGEADWAVVGTNIHIEVTGPLQPMKVDKPLWIRPDKVRLALALPETITWIVHCSHDNKLLRAIHIGPRFVQEMHRNKQIVIRKCRYEIRGNQETYLEIPASSKVVYPFQALINFIKGRV